MASISQTGRLLANQPQTADLRRTHYGELSFKKVLTSAGFLNDALKRITQLFG